MNNYYYRSVQDEKGETRFFIDKNGVAIPAVTYIAPAGSTSPITPAVQEQIKKRRLRQEREKICRNDKRKYTFVSSDRYNDISPESAGRLMYLCTYLRYDSNTLYRSRSKAMTKKEMLEVMYLPETTFRRFWKDVKDKYIFEDSEGNIRISSKFFSRGKLESEYSREWQKVYIQSMRELYRKTPIVKHRYLGYIFQVLPYINKSFNILCYNPLEDEFDKIQFLKLGDFADLCGLSNTQLSRIKDYYSEIKFKVDDHEELFCAFVGTSGNLADENIYVNPNILYNGNVPEAVRVLCGFCDNRKTTAIF